METLRAAAQKRLVDYLSLKGSPSVGMNSPSSPRLQDGHVLCSRADVSWLQAEAGREGRESPSSGVQGQE